MEFLKTLKLGDIFEIKCVLADKRFLWRKAIFLACWNNFVQFAFLDEDDFLHPQIMRVSSENVCVLGTHCKD